MISVNNLSFSYNGNNKILKNIFYSFQKGKFYGIAGSNGSGKTSFAMTLNGLIPKSVKGKMEGKIMVDGVSTIKAENKFLAGKVGMVFQNPDFSLFNLSVRDEILFGIENLKLNNPEDRIRKSLKIVGMPDTELQDPQTLSTGEKQKISLACVLALDTPYIVLDEPTAQLDYRSSMDLYNVLRKMVSSGKTVISIEHDTDFLAGYSEECLIFEKGEIVSSGKTKSVFSDKKLLGKLGIKIPGL